MGDTPSGRGRTSTALILAAGANTRLEGIVPPGFKPLIPVNGRSLFKHALDHANDVWGAQRIVTVVNPDNARALTQIGGSDDWIVQPSPDGVVDAIRRGLVAIDAEWTVVLCADNTFEIAEDVLERTRAHQWRRPLFGARWLPRDDAHRFTRYRMSAPLKNAFDTGEPITARFLDAKDTGAFDGCWIGPLVLRTDSLRRGMTMPTIVDCVNVATRDEVFVPVPMNCYDLGVPEAL